MKHFLVIFLCFSIEVKVKADEYSVETQKGKIEVDKQADGSTDIQTFSKAYLKVKFLGASLGIKENTFVSLKKKPQIHFGSVYVQNKDEEGFVINTKHGVVTGAAKNSIYIVTVAKTKTTVQVLMGAASINDRLNADQRHIVAGYQLSVGGLFADGKKAWGQYEPHDSLYALESFKMFSEADLIDKGITEDHIKIAWKKAVETVAQQTQDQIKNDLEKLKSIDDEKAKRRIASQKEKKKIKEHFRAKTLGLPGQSTEAPLE